MFSNSGSEKGTRVGVGWGGGGGGGGVQWGGVGWGGVDHTENKIEKWIKS